jgi:hypothetical protein
MSLSAMIVSQLLDLNIVHSLGICINQRIVWDVIMEIGWLIVWIVNIVVTVRIARIVVIVLDVRIRGIRSLCMGIFS